MIYRLLTFVFLGMFNSPVFSQVLFERDSSGIVIGGQYGVSEESRVVAFAPIAIIRGRVSCGFTIGTEYSKLLDESFFAIRPNVSYLLIKQGLKFPFSFGVHGAYQESISSGKVVSGFDYGLSIFQEFRGKTSVFPGFSYGWSRIATKGNTYSGIRDKGQNVRFFNISMILLFRSGLFFSPYYARHSTVSTVGLLVGVRLRSKR